MIKSIVLLALCMTVGVAYGMDDGSDQSPLYDSLTFPDSNQLQPSGPSASPSDAYVPTSTSHGSNHDNDNETIAAVLDQPSAPDENIDDELSNSTEPTISNDDTQKFLKLFVPDFSGRVFPVGNFIYDMPKTLGLFSSSEVSSVINRRDAKGETLLHKSFRLVSVRPEEVLNKGANPNIQDNNGKTALHKAIERFGLIEKYDIDRMNYNMSLISLILKKGADPGIKNNKGQNALDCFEKFYKLIKYYNMPREFYDIATMIMRDGRLILKGSWCYKKAQKNNPELKKFIKKNKKGWKKFLKEQGKRSERREGVERRETAQPSAASTLLRLLFPGLDKKSLVHIVAQYYPSKLGPMLPQLVAMGVDLNAKDNEKQAPLHRMVRGKQNLIYAMQLLIQKSVDPNVVANDDQSALHLAVKYWPQLIEPLIVKGATIDAQDVNGNTPLHVAIQRKKFDQVTLLINNGASLDMPNNKGQAALCMAYSFFEEPERMSLIDMLLEKGADINGQHAQGNTLLHLAINKGDLALVNYLLDKGADLKITNNNGQAALGMIFSLVFRLKIGQRIPLIGMLLEKGLKINEQDAQGNTLIHLAINNGDLALVNYLLDKDADLKIINMKDETALHCVVGNKQFFKKAQDAEESVGYALIDKLLQKGAQIDAQNGQGNTILHLAVLKESRPLINMLLKKNANYSMENNDGKIALRIMIDAQFNGIGHLLEDEKAIAALFADHDLSWIELIQNNTARKQVEKAIFNYQRKQLADS